MKTLKAFKIGCLGLVIFIVVGVGLMVHQTKSGNDYFERLESLPELEGILHSETLIVAPISGKETAGVRLYVEASYPSNSTDSISLSGPYKNEYLFLSDDAWIEIDGKSYEIAGEFVRGIAFGGIKTENVNDEIDVIDNRYIGVDSHIDINLKDLNRQTSEGEIQIDSDVEPRLIEEYCYEKGSMIRFKGRIEGDKVIFFTRSDAK